MIGNKFGKWTVVERVKSPEGPSKGFRHFLCRCECGKESVVRVDGLKNGRSSQCIVCHDKQMYINIQDMVGKKYGKWTVISTVESKLQRRVLCRCECNKEQIITASRIKSGAKSCPTCNVKKHGYEGTPTYNTWRCMIARCTRENNSNYRNYAGRGISVCQRWRTFSNFLIDMGPKPIGLQLDRINNDGNYEPGNCRWVTAKQNSANRRKRPVLWNKKKSPVVKKEI